jgi:hypothetical protein
MLDERIASLELEYGQRRTFAMALHAKMLRAERARQRDHGGLMCFIKYFWDILEPSQDFAQGWALEAMCLHLEAVHHGYIRKLLINVPPGSMKSLLCNVFFPAWQWTAGSRPSNRFVSFSYASHLTERDNDKMLQLMQHPRFIELWSKVWKRDGKGRIITDDAGRPREFEFTLRDKGKTKVGNTLTGWKLATSVGGVGTGERGDVVLLDDPHSIKDDNSEVVRPETVRWFKEAMSNRLNNMEKSAIIAIMQRSHEADVAGEILSAPNQMGYVHLNIPLHYEPDRHCVTYLPGVRDNAPFWEDPRVEDGENFWPERFPPAAIDDIMQLGDHVYVGQYQQRPEPRGGGLFKRAYWRDYGPHVKDGKFPKFEYILASLDPAFTEKEENDPCGFSVWGVFRDPEGSMSAMLLVAWRKHLTLKGTARQRGKTESWGDYKAETEREWGVVQWARYECQRFKAHKLLVENKGGGHHIAQELVTQSEHDPWAIEMVDPGRLDKLARGHRVQPVFADGLVWCIKAKAYAKLIIDEMASFTRGRFKDITDSATQALWWLRCHGFLEAGEVLKTRQFRAAQRAGKKTKGNSALYPV